MDVHVIDAEEGLGHRGMSDDGDAEPGEGGEANNAENSLVHDEDGICEPYVGLEFNSDTAAKSYYDEYAKCMGFSAKVGQTRSKDGTIIAREFVCGKEGFKRRPADSCDALLMIELKGDKWVVTKFVKEHSHSILSPSKVHYLRPRRHFAGAAKTVADSCQGVGVVPSGVIQYERAMEDWFEREIEADYDTICTTPVLRTPSPMEKQAADLYTRKIFTKFQEELVETFVYTANRIEGDGAISTFRVAKFEDDNKAYMVTLNYPEMRANCSCQMFEYSGILCRHVLTVFTVTNVLTLPPHYILKRWTRNAKSSGVGTDERSTESQGQETLTRRYSSLCREAIKYAEEGAIATETYNVAMGALKEGGKKIAVMKKNVAKVAPPGSQASGATHDDKKSSTSAPDTVPLLWPRQDEVTRRFNLNDTGTPAQSVSDSNLPRMAPVSLHRDDGHPDNMPVLPCLKSMTWVMEKNLAHGRRVAVINLKLQDYSKNPSAEMEVKFQLSKLTLEPMLRSMAYISEQLSTPANKVAVINLKLQDAETPTGESEVKFQVSRDTLGAMLRSMAYIREQLSVVVTELQSEPLPKKQRK
ncbi:hypothetical protein CCACVL1_20462 [Corchorus capsularis]|uniref:Protein FAR1-RELATED SEQUENCE n=1 Tax=Corchorus capsularis TaxID=210143 RepID=A0A1R3HB08_COCAP|nr:hypothetical protein CCACVL1_20462 [Corchorus capsularis]